MPERMYNNFIPVSWAHLSSDQGFISIAPKMGMEQHNIGFLGEPPNTQKFQ